MPGDREWMRSLCCDDQCRPHICTPFRQVVFGREWDCATNGHAVLLVGGQCQFEAREDAPKLEYHLRSSPKLRHAGKLSKIREWLATLEPRRANCGCVGGCDDCDGTGSYEPPIVVSFFGTHVNGSVLKRYLEHVQAEFVRVAARGDDPVPLLVDGGDWRFYLMPMLPCGAEVVSEFPGKAAVA